MNRIKVKSTVECLEVNGEEHNVGERETIDVLSHWNRDDLAILVVGGNKYTVSIDCLQAAMKNARNCR